MRCADWHCYIVSCFCVDVRVVRGVETYGSLGDEEGFVVHFMPMGWGTGCLGGKREFGGAEAVVFLRVFVRLGYGWEIDGGYGIPVLEPSSIIRHVMGPSFRISPVWAGTWVRGLRGIFRVRRVWWVSGSMVSVIWLTECMGEWVGVSTWWWESWKEFGSDCR